MPGTRRGRPEKMEVAKKNRRITIRLDADMDDLLRDLMSKTGDSAAEIIRKSLIIFWDLSS